MNSNSTSLSRRDFLKAGSIGTAALVSTGYAGRMQTTASTVKRKIPLTAGDLNSYLRSLNLDVPKRSVDRIIIGNPDTVVKKIGTVWLPTWKACREAVEKGVNALVVHEPTFYNHRDLDMEKGGYLAYCQATKTAYTQLRDKKIKWINENGLVIVRCHDVWDRISEFGVPYALGKTLGFTNNDIIKSEPYYNVYKIAPKPAVTVAKNIAEKLKNLGQPGVAFYGDENYKVRTVGVGCGCACDPMHYRKFDPDLFIAIDDVVRTWVQTAYANDSGHPLVVINHGTSEEPGIRLLNAHLKKEFPDIEVIHIQQGCGYKWITG